MEEPEFNVEIDIDKPDSWADSFGEWHSSPGAILDLSGHPGDHRRIPERLLNRLPRDGTHIAAIDCSHAVLERISWEGCTIGNAHFDGARFDGDVDVRGARFTGRAGFAGANFGADAYFHGATFDGSARFAKARFAAAADFDEATFTGDVSFDDAQFTAGPQRVAGFGRATFGGRTSFSRAEFNTVGFGEATFAGVTSFDNARFTTAKFTGAAFDERVVITGAIVAAGAGFDHCRFGADLVAGALAVTGSARFRGARFAGDCDFEGVEVAELDLSQATFTGPSHELFVTGTERYPVVLMMQRTRITGDTVIVLGHRSGLDASRIVVRAPATVTADRPDRRGALVSVLDADITAPFRVGRHIDLSQTLWGDHDLTTITLASTNTLPRTGTLYTLLRGSRLPNRVAQLPQGRRVLSTEHEAGSEDDLRTLEHNYRDLRRQLEATGNTHGANDFYFGEMEARRRRLPRTSPRRWLLELYRLVCGYGTSAWPAVLVWQLAVVVATELLLVGGVNITEDRVYTWSEVWRFALEGSFSFFRPTNAPLLSISETMIMITMRILGPLLLALAALAVRNQTKR